jgi:pimeloyl-ACP methyl ester carboxylesterase
MSRKTFAMTIGALVVAAGLAVVPSSPSAQAGPGGAVTAPSAFRAAPVDWQRCKDRDLKKAKARCGYLVVPLDYANPTGPTIQLAVSRILHTKGPYRGAAFANPGGPGASALQYSRLGGAIPHGVGKTYDWYGMDPRGVGASIPALSCDPKFGNSQHRPYQPTTTAILSYWLAKTEAYAAACGTSAAKDLLPHLRTTDNVADFESLRTAIGQAQVTYYGFSYGTYLGQVWATLHPGSLKAMVLDGVVNPGRVWYQANLDQDHAFGIVYKKFFTWIGKRDRTFHLGRTGRQVGKRFAKVHKQLARKPARGKLGAGELEDVLTTAGYTNQAWPSIASAISELANRGSAGALIQMARPAKGPKADNEYAMYLATECTDAPWPTDWNVWAADNTVADQDSPYLAWGNAWFNAPCRTWPVPSNPAPFVVNGAAFTGPVLITNETFDAATPFSGALAARSLFPTASLIEGKRGTTHAATLSGVSCVDDAVAALLRSGKLPSRKAGAGPDKKCPGLAPPRLDASQSRVGGLETLASASSSTSGGRQVS